GYSRSSRSVLDLNVEIEKLTGSLARLAKAPRTTPVEDDALIRRNTLRLEIEEIERYIEMRETALEKILRRGTRDPGNKYKIEELVRQADVEYGLLMELQKQ